MKNYRTALFLGLGCMAAVGCGSDLLDDILKRGHGGSGGGQRDGGAGGTGGTTSPTGDGGAVEHCGGNTANPPRCRPGYECVPVPGSTLPFGDVGGICVLPSTPPRPPRQQCGGFANFPCPGFGKCADDPTDDCDPANGGADCIGVCSCVQNVLCGATSVFDSSPRVCACVLKKPVCGPVCQVFCEFGNVRDANGCPTCACNPPPAPNPCPPDKCKGPGPKTTNITCSDGHVIAGPTCVENAYGGCEWTVASCPIK